MRGSWPLTLQVCLHCQGCPGVSLRHAWLLWPRGAFRWHLGLGVEAISMCRTLSARDPATVLAPGCLRPRLEEQRRACSRGPRHRVTLQREAAATGASVGHRGRGRGTPRLPGSPLSQTRAQHDKAVGSGTHCLWGQACLRAEHRRPRPRPRQGVQQTCGAGSARTRRAVVRGPLPGPGFPASPLGKHWPKVAPLSSVFFGAETSTQGAGGPGRLRPPGPPSCVRTQLSSGPQCPLLSSPLPRSPGSPRPDRSPGRKSAAALRPEWQLTSRL